MHMVNSPITPFKPPTPVSTPHFFSSCLSASAHLPVGGGESRGRNTYADYAWLRREKGDAWIFFFFLGFIKKFPSQKNSVKIKSYAFAFSYLRRLPLMNSGACLGEVLRTWWEIKSDRESKKNRKKKYFGYKVINLLSHLQNGGWK